MGTELVTANAVRQALGAARAARPLGDNPLMQLDAVSLRLRDEGMTDSRDSREWALMELLAELIEANLARARGLSEPRPVGSVQVLAPAPPQARALLQADFRASSPDREAWSTLYHRYLAPSALHMDEIAALAGVPRRTLARRFDLGIASLTRALRERERMAEKQLGPRIDETPAPALGPTNLPAETTSFVGRQGELEAIAQRLADPACRLLTLVGPGGMGKTRLARVAAAAQRHAFPDGVFLAPLAPLGSAEQVVTAVAQSVGLAFAGASSPLDELLSFLRPSTCCSCSTTSSTDYPRLTTLSTFCARVRLSNCW
jgi:hypothetical protein